MAERGMKKFLPFSSLTEQANFINEMVYEKNKIPKPQISNEQAEKINRILFHINHLLRNLDLEFLFLTECYLQQKPLLLNLLERIVRNGIYVVVPENHSLQVALQDYCFFVLQIE